MAVDAAQRGRAGLSCQLLDSRLSTAPVAAHTVAHGSGHGQLGDCDSLSLPRVLTPGTQAAAKLGGMKTMPASCQPLQLLAIAAGACAAAPAPPPHGGRTKRARSPTSSDGSCSETLLKRPCGPLAADTATAPPHGASVPAVALPKQQQLQHVPPAYGTLERSSSSDDPLQSAARWFALRRQVLASADRYTVQRVVAGIEANMTAQEKRALAAARGFLSSF